LKRFTFVTGQSGVGKTRVLLRVAKRLKEKGYKVGGMVSSEVREGGVRVGFEIIDVKTGRRGWLAHINQLKGPKVGKYRVNLNDLNGIGACSILEAARNADIVIIDEIGPMELFSSAFREAIVYAMKSKKLIVGTIHQRVRHQLLTTIGSNNNTEIFKVTLENREQLHNSLIDKTLKSLEGCGRKTRKF
jgi:nucleoside-triphosphatase